MRKDATNFEASISYMIEKSNKRAWLITFISCFITIILAIAVCLLTPLKSVEPYVIRVDDAGMVDIITKLDSKNIKTTEAIDKFFIADYVKAREGYNYTTISNEYYKVQLLSDPAVANVYRKIFAGEEGRDKVLKDDYIITPEILSITLGQSSIAKTATIRLNLIKKPKGSTDGIKTTEVITLSYGYFPSKSANESVRLTNPLGFKVLSYRIDHEIQR